MKRVIGMFLLMLLCFTQMSEKAVAVSGNELMDAFSVRITVVEEDVEYQWEFDNPNHYEYEKGTKVMKGDHAKVQVLKMTALLQLDQTKTADQYKQVLKPYYPQMSSFEIRWMDSQSERYIWSWEK